MIQIMEERIEKLERELALMRERNVRVEAEKAWETSWFRIASISVLTYIVACLLLAFLGVEHFMLNALLPALGYFLSTQSLPVVKKWWIEKRLNSKSS